MSCHLNGCESELSLIISPIVFVSAFSLRSSNAVASIHLHENAETKTKRGESSPRSDSSFIMNQMLLPIFASHIACESFNLTSFTVLSDAGGGVNNLK